MTEVDEVVHLNFLNEGRVRRWKGALNLLRRGYDLTIGGVWYFNLPDAIFSGAPVRLSLYDGHPLQRYADHVVPLDPCLHEADNNLRLAEVVCGRASDEERIPRLAWTTRR